MEYKISGDNLQLVTVQIQPGEKIYAESGKPVTNNICIPVDIINFFNRLIEQYGFREYDKYSSKAFNWIKENPLRTFNWEAQFEDMEPTKSYKNLG